MESGERTFRFLLIGVFGMFGILIGGIIYESHIIATAPDPITTACALGKERACTALANRKP